MSNDQVRLLEAQDAHIAALRTALRSFLHLFSHNEDGEPEDMIANLPDAHAFEMIDQAAHRDAPIPTRAPCVTVGQIRRAREALGYGSKQATAESHNA